MYKGVAVVLHCHAVLLVNSVTKHNNSFYWNCTGDTNTSYLYSCIHISYKDNFVIANKESIHLKTVATTMERCRTYIPKGLTVCK